MELSYPGYKSYFSRFSTKPFHTEYSIEYGKSETPVMNSQVPRYTWFETRRPTVAPRRREMDGTTKLTHLRPPFAARMTSYDPEEKYLRGKMAREEAAVVTRGGSPKGRSLKLPEVSPPSTAERVLSRKEIEGDNGLQMERMSQSQSAREARTSAKQAQLNAHQFSSAWLEHDHISGSPEPIPSRPRIASSFSAVSEQKFHKAPRTLTRDQHAQEAMTSNPTYEQPLGRVAPRPSTLLSKHPKDVRYVRDTCYFQPTHERKKHYYIVNPNWFSEHGVTIPKNNVFS